MTLTTADGTLILVYCGSRMPDNDAYAAATRLVADRMADMGIGLVYGGSGNGLMGILAKRLLERDGHVTGILPSFLHTTEIALTTCTELVEVSSMHERKLTMLDRAHAILALPGGYGTMDELFEAVTWRQIGLHNKPIAILNVDGFYDHLSAQLDVMTRDGFLTAEARSHIRISCSIDDLLPWLQENASSLKPDPLLPRWT